jgi:hypothetical protein
LLFLAHHRQPFMSRGLSYIGLSTQQTKGGDPVS